MHSFVDKSFSKVPLAGRPVILRFVRYLGMSCETGDVTDLFRAPLVKISQLKTKDPGSKHVGIIIKSPALGNTLVRSHAKCCVLLRRISLTIKGKNLKYKTPNF